MRSTRRRKAAPSPSRSNRPARAATDRRAGSPSASRTRVAACQASWVPRSSSRLSRRNRPASGWDCRFANESSSRMAGKSTQSAGPQAEPSSRFDCPELPLPKLLSWRRLLQPRRIPEPPLVSDWLSFSMARLLVIDDEPNLQYSLVQSLSSEKLDVATAGTARLGIEAVRQQRPDVVILDVRLPDLDGLEAFEVIRRIDPRLPVIIITVFGTAETAIEATK